MALPFIVRRVTPSTVANAKQRTISKAPFRPNFPFLSITEAKKLFGEFTPDDLVLLIPEIGSTHLLTLRRHLQHRSRGAKGDEMKSATLQLLQRENVVSPKVLTSCLRQGSAAVAPTTEGSSKTISLALRRCLVDCCIMQLAMAWSLARLCLIETDTRGLLSLLFTCLAAATVLATRVRPNNVAELDWQASSSRDDLLGETLMLGLPLHKLSLTREASALSLRLLLGNDSSIQRFQGHDLHVDLHDPVVVQLARSLAVNASLKAFCLTETHLYYCETVVMLLAGLAGNRWLQEVDLSGLHPMSARCVPLLVTAILYAAVRSSSMERLSLKNVRYRDHDGLVAALHEMEGLKELYLELDWRCCGPGSSRDCSSVDRNILQALESNQSLTEFSGGDHWDFSHRKAVNDLLWRNRCRHHLKSNQYELSIDGFTRLIETAATKMGTVGADVIFDLLSSRPDLLLRPKNQC